MHQLLVLATVSVLVAVSSAAPWFCQEYSCPDFTAEDKGAYEIRDYVATNWVATSVMSHRPYPTGNQGSIMFKKLFHYIGGDNVKREKMDMTVPVLTKIEKQKRLYKVTMMFYLTDKNPPAPTKHGVFLVQKPAGKMFVRAFPTWRWPSDWFFRSELYDMKKAIGDSSLYDNTAYYKAGYDSPYDFLKRKQHEVWMDVKSTA